MRALAADSSWCSTLRGAGVGGGKERVDGLEKPRVRGQVPLTATLYKGRAQGPDSLACRWTEGGKGPNCRPRSDRPEPRAGKQVETSSGLLATAGPTLQGSPAGCPSGPRRACKPRPSAWPAGRACGAGAPARRGACGACQAARTRRRRSADKRALPATRREHSLLTCHLAAFEVRLKPAVGTQSVLIAPKAQRGAWAEPRRRPGAHRSRSGSVLAARMAASSASKSFLCASMSWCSSK